MRYFVRFEIKITLWGIYRISIWVQRWMYSLPGTGYNCMSDKTMALLLLDPNSCLDLNRMSVYGKTASREHHYLWQHSESNPRIHFHKWTTFQQFKSKIWVGPPDWVFVKWTLDSAAEPSLPGGASKVQSVQFENWFYFLQSFQQLLSFKIVPEKHGCSQCQQFLIDRHIVHVYKWSNHWFWHNFIARDSLSFFKNTNINSNETSASRLVWNVNQYDQHLAVHQYVYFLLLVAII